MKLRDPEIARLCRELAMLVRSGVSVAEGMFLLAQETPASQQQALEAMGRSLDGGVPLSEAMCRCGALPEHVWRMVRVGEETGRQEEALQNLAVFYEERCRTRHQLQSAVAYPALVLVMMLLMVGTLLVKVVPVFDRVYASLGSRLTGAGAKLLYLGQGIERSLPVLLLLVLLLTACAAVIRFSPVIRERLQHLLRKHFGDRGIGRKFANARFARAMAMGMGSGLSLEQGLELACDVLQDSPGAARRCAACARAVEEGMPFAQAAAQAELLPSGQSRMLQLAIRSGNAEEMMDTIACKQLEEAQTALEDAISRVEPAMVLISSLLVGLILLSVMLPLVDILSVLG